MEIQERRDQKTVTIGAALGMFALIVIVGSATLWIAGVSEGLSTTLPLFAVAGLAMIVYLVRHRR